MIKSVKLSEVLKMSQNVLVMGGSYFIGRKIVDILIENNYNVTVLNRGTHTVQNTTQIICNRDNIAEMSKALQDKSFDYVIDVSGVNKNQIQTLCSCLKMADIKKFVFISSSAVYDIDNLIIPFKEKDSLATNNHWFDYGTNKIKAESYLTDFFADKPTQLIMLRPPYMYGENNYAQRESFIFNRLSNNLPVILPSSNPKLQFLYTTDLANIVISLLDNESQKVAIYNVGNKQPVTSMEWVEYCGSVLNKKPEIIMYDYKKDGYYIRDFFPFPDYDNVLDVSKINASITLNETLFVDGLKESYKWYIENKDNICFKPHIEENCNKIFNSLK